MMGDFGSHDPPGALSGFPGMIDPAETEAFGGTGQVREERVDRDALRRAVIEVLKTVYDPEIPVDIYELGLIYRCDIDDQGAVEIEMTLTAPGCPVAGSLVKQVAERVGGVPGVSRSHVQLVWDPPWTQDRMSEAAQLELGLL